MCLLQYFVAMHIVVMLALFDDHMTLQQCLELIIELK
jgi:hypothetical protein